MKISIPYIILAILISFIKCDEKITCTFLLGLGKGINGAECGISLSRGCTAFYGFINKLPEIRNKPEIIADLLEFVFAMEDEYSFSYTKCKFIEIFTDIWKKVTQFIKNLGKNWEIMQSDANCANRSIFSHDYEQAGICIGHLILIITT